VRDEHFEQVLTERRHLCPGAARTWRGGRARGGNPWGLAGQCGVRSRGAELRSHGGVRLAFLREASVRSPPGQTPASRPLRARDQASGWPVLAQPKHLLPPRRSTASATRSHRARRARPRSRVLRGRAIASYSGAVAARIRQQRVDERPEILAVRVRQADDPRRECRGPVGVTARTSVSYKTAAAPPSILSA
jgi:hypothetical protein